MPVLPPLLPPLASPAHLAASLGRVLSVEEELQASVLLDQASSVVRSYLRLEVTRRTSTLTVPLARPDRSTAALFDAGCGGQVRLPERPVEDVTAVTVNGTPTTGWWLEGDVLSVRSAPWPAYGSGHGAPRVAVTYLHGWDPVPGDIQAIVIQAVNRVMVNPGQIRSQVVGGESTTYLITATGDALGVLLSRTEQKALDRYRRTSGSVRVRSR